MDQLEVLTDNLKLRCTQLPIPTVTEEMIAKMEYNKQLAIEEYGDPFGYLWNRDNEESSAED